jgi:hypothetical protein
MKSICGIGMSFGYGLAGDTTEMINLNFLKRIQ